MNTLCRMGTSTALALAIFLPVLSAQTPIITESGEQKNTPIDGVVRRESPKERRILQYDYVHEKDVFWEKRVWQRIDLRERMNLFFAYEKEPLIEILLDHAKNDEITLYSTFDDEFKIPLSVQEVYDLCYESDTITTYDPETYEPVTQVIYNEFDPHTVVEYRLKEVWFFDEETSRMRVRILGIAPIRDVYDEHGNHITRMPMFWAYYPELRIHLAQHNPYNEANDAGRLTWEDIFEMRYFSSVIIKESNVFDRRIQDYKSGVDALAEAEKIKESVRNFEHDLWEY